MVKPITPKAARAAKMHIIPEFVFQAFNDMVTKKLEGRCAYFLEKDVVAQILVTAQAAEFPTTKEAIYANNWLDVEDVYRKAGWTVEYDSPAYNESYASSFKFTASADSLDLSC
jgi:hypothetical protein